MRVQVVGNRTHDIKTVYRLSCPHFKSADCITRYNVSVRSKRCRVFPELVTGVPFYDIIMLQVTWLLLVLVLHSESRVLVKRSFKDQSVKAYLTEVI